jgi:predicted DNA-binding transcriptional regulator AlpA
MIREMVKRSALAKMLGLTVDQIRHHERFDRAFPRSVRLTESGRAVAYYVDEISDWQKRIAEKRQNKTPR